MKKMKKKLLKLGIVTICILAIGTANAQQKTGNVGKQTNTVLGATSGSVKLIDNKGTIKYLQSKNGLTTFTDTAPDGGVITTWQLGGILTDATNIETGANEFKITLDAGGTFVLDGTIQETGTSADAGTIGTSGWTFLTRDEATGQVKKLLASDLVSGIRVEHTQPTNASADVAITVNGLPLLTASTTFGKLFVYRNGAKLRTVTDYVATLNTVTINYSPTDLPMYAGDIIEIQFIK